MLQYSSKPMDNDDPFLVHIYHKYYNDVFFVVLFVNILSIMLPFFYNLYGFDWHILDHNGWLLNMIQACIVRSINKLQIALSHKLC